MKIDFKQLAKVEKQYRYDNPVCCNTLETMVNLVLSDNPADVTSNKPGNLALAITTLADLGILKNEGATQQLNS